jgi:hypothetical protein
MALPKVRLLYEPGYATPSVGNIIEEISRANVLISHRRMNTRIMLKIGSSNTVMMT